MPVISNVFSSFSDIPLKINNIWFLKFCVKFNAMLYPGLMVNILYILYNFQKPLKPSGIFKQREKLRNKKSSYLIYNDKEVIILKYKSTLFNHGFINS